MGISVADLAAEGPHVADAHVSDEMLGLREHGTPLPHEGGVLDCPVRHQTADSQTGPLFVSDVSQLIEFSQADDPFGPGDALLDEDHQGDAARHDGDVLALPRHHVQRLFQTLRFYHLESTHRLLGFQCVLRTVQTETVQTGMFRTGTARPPFEVLLPGDGLSPIEAPPAEFRRPPLRDGPKGTLSLVRLGGDSRGGGLLCQQQPRECTHCLGLQTGPHPQF